MEPVNLLPNKMNWSSYHLSKGSKKSRAGVGKLNLPCQTVEPKSLPTLPHVTDMQSMLKFRYELFEVLRRKFPQPEQSANCVSDKELMREIDCKESDERMELDNKYLHEKDIMTLNNGGGSYVFDMPFNASGKTLHKAGVGSNEFDFIIKHSGSVTDLDDAMHEQFSHDMKYNLIVAHLNR
jgi:hypothetical protein